MEILKSDQTIRGRLKQVVLTLGNFDGIHLGHQKIFRELIKEARSINGKSAVYTFKPHPLKVLRPDKILPLISLFDEKVKLIESFGIDYFIYADFTLEFANQSAEEFVTGVLCDLIPVRKILVGYDYAFGKDRQGNTEYLKRMGRIHDFQVRVIDPVAVDGRIVSSRAIRELVQNGDVGFAAKMLGRPFSIEGIVIEGKKRGKDLGFPTANLRIFNELYPKPGVYAVRAVIKGRSFDGMANIGTNPTFRDQMLSFEVHLFDFDQELYGERLKVCYVERLRDEIAFPSPDALIEQLRLDEIRSREILRGAPAAAHTP